MADAGARGTSRVIEAYGAGGFRVDGEAFRGSVIVLPDGVVPWSVDDIAAVTLESLEPVIAAAGEVEILLIGSGARFGLVAPALRGALHARGLAADAMDTGAACRTYNVLRAEGRRVAAALIAVGEGRQARG
jgi:uncharacterized protein